MVSKRLKDPVALFQLTKNDGTVCHHTLRNYQRATPPLSTDTAKCGLGQRKSACFQTNPSCYYSVPFKYNRT